jgi:hypothetical protein
MTAAMQRVPILNRRCCCNVLRALQDSATMSVEDLLKTMGLENTKSNLAVALCAQYTQLQLHIARLRAALPTVSTTSTPYTWLIILHACCNICSCCSIYT